MTGINKNKVKRITAQAAALILREEGISCDQNKITRWCRDGVLKRSKQIGRQWYVNEDEIREMLRED